MAEIFKTRVEDHEQNIYHYHTSSDVVFRSDGSTVESALNKTNTDVSGKAPIYHPSTSTMYGPGNANYFGHTKLSNTHATLVGNASDSLAASQSALYNAYHALNNKFINYLPLDGGTMKGPIISRAIYPSSYEGAQLGLKEYQWAGIWARKFASATAVDVVAQNGQVSIFGNKILCRSFDNSKYIHLEASGIYHLGGDLDLKSTASNVNIWGHSLKVVNTGNTGFVEVHASAFRVNSDMRKKKNVRSIKGNESRKIVESISPIEFEYLDADKKHRGFSAQEVEKIIKQEKLKEQIYTYDQEKDEYFIDKTELIPDLVNCVKSLYGEIDNLRHELAEIKAK